jgi:hypothetical protein
MFLVHLNSGDTMSAQFNPQEISEKVEAEWAEPEIEGSSSQPLVYRFTKNHPITFELGYDEQSGRDILSGGPNLGGNISIQKARNWLLALMYRQAGDVDVSGGAPSPVLLIWPNLFSVKTRVKMVDIKHKLFASDNLRSAIYSAKLNVVIDSLFQNTYESVLANGTERDDASVATVSGQTF